MDASAGAFLQTNPFAQLTIANACGDVDAPLPAPTGTASVQAQALRAASRLHQQQVRGQLLKPRAAWPAIDGGIDGTALQLALGKLLDSVDPLVTLMQPGARVLRAAVATLRLHPLAQWLLTAAAERHPAAFQHAVRAMALAGSLAWHVRANGEFLQRAMLAGLLHDIGEIYVEPAYLGSGRQLDLREYRQLAAHPHVGAMLLTDLTDYPAEIARAVAEHHERLDGTGYPFQLLGGSLSPLGQLMAVVELVLGIVDQQRPAPAARASFALRFVPGELSGPWTGPIARWADGEPPALPPAQPGPGPHAEMAQLDQALQGMQDMAETISAQLDGSSKRVAQRAAHRLNRLRSAWNAMGLWSLPADLVEPRERFDIELALRELRWRISTIGRDCLWPETELKVLADARLVPLWTTLESLGRSKPAS
ncbi:HD domain-containing protein [Aquincola sp. S2]|uniref:HD domain-containing protein n=1 Tax=Pseudaquabacterium terrae TaxID=2732868 RepID=A0ABX2EMW8_9BURK|nr:HD domain-containing phosphohydrolase [Aquabacterium terrae]NRF69976.1 HD domain-containing protein [Aquabacterium terrae]